MTTLIHREDRTAADDHQVASDPVAPKPKRARGWLVSLVAAAAIATGAAGITTAVSQDNVATSLDYRVLGEAEALARFAPTVDAPLTYRVFGETEALARFAPTVDAPLTYRVLGETEALARFAG